MPNAVTHILIPIILADLIRDYWIKNKKKITTTRILIAGIGGMLPDIDIVFGLVAAASSGESLLAFHRTITHSALIPLIILGAAIVLHQTKKENASKIFLMAGFGYSIHLLLDALMMGSIMPFYPISTAKVGLNLLNPNGMGNILVAGLDAVLLLAWLIHEQIKHRITDYI